MKKNLPLFIVVFVILVMVSIGVISAQEGSTLGSAGGVSIADAAVGVISEPAVSAAEVAAAEAYWTPERLAAAKPMQMIDYGSPTVDRSALRDDKAATGEPGSTAGGQAAPNADAIARSAYPEAWAAIDAAELEMAAADAPLADDGTSQEFTSYFLRNKNISQKWYPHRWVGRLATSTGTCSATAISNNHILTAAHCVYNTTTNTWNSNRLFYPGYRAGNAPYGSFSATGCKILSSYVAQTGSYSISGWAKYDIAVCAAGTNSAGKTLNQMVGWAGREWNYNYTRHLHELGLPFRNYQNVTIPNAGKFLHVCVAESRYYTTDTRGMGCDMGPGVSGGPWMKHYAPTIVSGSVSGVNSGLFINVKNLYAPRFTSNNIVVLCNSHGC